MEIHSTSNCLAIAELFGRQGINSAKCMYGECPQQADSPLGRKEIQQANSSMTMQPILLMHTEPPFSTNEFELV